MAKRTWQAVGLGAGAAALLAIQVTAFWAAAPYARTLISHTKVARMWVAGNRVAKLVKETSGDAMTVRISKASKVVKVRTETISEMPTPETHITAWDAAELPAAPPEEIVTVTVDPEPASVSTIGRPLVAPGCEQKTCSQPCPSTAKSRSLKGRTVATADAWDSSDDASATGSKDDRARDRESHHESGIGPIKPATLGSVW